MLGVGAAMKTLLLCCTMGMLLTGCFIFGDRFGSVKAVALTFLPPEPKGRVNLSVTDPHVQEALQITDAVLLPQGRTRTTPSPAPNTAGVIAFYESPRERAYDS